jgi:hypothetical protein
MLLITVLVLLDVFVDFLVSQRMLAGCFPYHLHLALLHCHFLHLTSPPLARNSNSTVFDFDCGRAPIPSLSFLLFSLCFPHRYTPSWHFPSATSFFFLLPFFLPNRPFSSSFNFFLSRFLFCFVPFFLLLQTKLDRIVLDFGILNLFPYYYYIFPIPPFFSFLLTLNFY